MRQLHREFLRAGANVMQTFTFYASDDKLENRGNKLTNTVSSAIKSHTVMLMSVINLMFHGKYEIVISACLTTEVSFLGRAPRSTRPPAIWPARSPTRAMPWLPEECLRLHPTSAARVRPM